MSDDSITLFYVARLRGMGLRNLRVVARKWIGWQRIGVRPWVRGGSSPSDVELVIGVLADHHRFAGDTYKSAMRYRVESDDAARSFISEWDGVSAPGTDSYQQTGCVSELPGGGPLEPT